ncbi:MAG TPA: low temperature requirement protein A [Trebonia sp.]|nr:low temperature requirement protein A [Trebonia sp.]
MTTKEAPLRDPETPMRATFLELFFDLGFVFAFLQLSHALAEHLQWSGAFHALVVLMALWRVWLVTIWITNRLDPDRLVLQLLVLVALLASLALATALPHTFTQDGVIFACVYVAIQVGRPLFLLFLLGGSRAKGPAVRALWSSGVAVVPWIAGGFAHGVARSGLWALGVAVEYGVFALNLPLPWAGRTGPWEPPTSAEHLAERYRQLFIIALGELILASGKTFNDGRSHPTQMAAFAVSVVMTALFWRVYIFRAGEELPAAFKVASTPARLGLGPIYVHLVMVAGIVVTAVGDQLFIAQPFGRTPLAWVLVILGGPVIFLAGRTGFAYVVFAKIFWHCLAAAAVLAAAIPLALVAPPLVAAVIATVVLLAVAIADAAREWSNPGEPRPPVTG